MEHKLINTYHILVIYKYRQHRQIYTHHSQQSNNFQNFLLLETKFNIRYLRRLQKDFVKKYLKSNAWQLIKIWYLQHGIRAFSGHVFANLDNHIPIATKHFRTNQYGFVNEKVKWDMIEEKTQSGSTYSKSTMETPKRRLKSVKS